MIETLIIADDLSGWAVFGGRNDGPDRRPGCAKRCESGRGGRQLPRYGTG
jgi:hypothetical protein